MECPECNGRIIIKIIPYSYRNQIYFGEFEAEVCTKCGNAYFTEESFKKIEIHAKLQGIWGRETLTPRRIEVSTSGKNIPIVNSRVLFSKTPSEIYINEMSVSVI